eukprot:c11948_g1_i1.p1 GENE.c11948_g1_i1~~c11948_g1_i1.p1  ORF type:complete len:854 (+),score=315.20 c11948_g1_i1:51-2564(+)
MADTSSSSKQSQGNTRAQLISQMKQALPHFADEKIREVISKCDDDEGKLSEWINHHFDKNPAKDWSEVGKKSKQANLKDKKAEDNKPIQSKLPARGTKGRNAADTPRDRSGNSMTFAIPKGKHPTIIGIQGKTIQALQAETGARIFVPNRDEQSTLVRLMGEPATVEAAKGRLEQLLNFPLKTGDLGIITMSIPKKAHSAIIGKGGQILSDLEKTHGCAIQFPGRQDDTNEVRIQGVREDCHMTCDDLTSIAAKEGCSVQILSLSFGSDFDTPNVSLPTPAASSDAQQHHQGNAANNNGLLNGTSDGITSGIDNIGAHLGSNGVGSSSSAPAPSSAATTSTRAGSSAASSAAAAASSAAQHTGSAGSAGSGVLFGYPGQAKLPPPHNMLAPASLLPNPQAQEDTKAAAIANEIIDKLIGSGLSLDLESRFHGLLLPTANMVQYHMRVRLHERVQGRRHKLAELEQQGGNEFVTLERLDQEVHQKEKLLEQLRDDMRKLQLRVSATETDLLKTRKDHASAKHRADAVGQQVADEKQQVDLFEHALVKAESAAQRVTAAWDSWLKKLSQHNINDWDFSDMNTLLGCLGVSPQFFKNNGIEPSMLACIDDSLLRELSWNNERLRFGERRHLLIALRAILNAQRKPLTEGTHAASFDVVTYLMMWGLNIQVPSLALSSHPLAQKHAIAWSVEDVATLFRRLGLEAAAQGCERERVCGAVLLTMYRKDCFTLELPTLGDAIHMWKEASMLQRNVFGKNLPTNTGLWTVDDSPVQRLSPEDVAKCFEDHKLAELAVLCIREKVSGVVVASVRRMEDIATVDFACPGDRIRFLKVCEQLTLECK